MDVPGAQPTFQIMATYLDADRGLFEIAEAFFITALDLWPFPLFFKSSSSIRLPNIARQETSLDSSFAAESQNLRKTPDRLKEVARELTNLGCLFSDRTA
jgi:hypothetical protein